MLFIVDAQLSPKLKDWLHGKGHQALHASEMNLPQPVPDIELWRKAVALGAIIITKDKDFAVLLQTQKQAVQVVWVKSGNMSNDRFFAALDSVWADLEAELTDGDEFVLFDAAS